MKNLSLNQNKTFFRIWCAYHLFILTAFISVFFIKGRKINIDSDLFNMIPKPVMQKSLNAADEKLTEMTGQNMFILVSNENFDIAKAAAVELYDQMTASVKFENVSLYQDMSGMNQVMSFIQENRLNLLGNETVALLNSENGPETFCENALSQAYGGFTMSSLENLSEDPFMLGESALENYLSYLQSSGTSMSLKDGVLASYSKPNGIDGVENARWYIMIRANLSREGSALASKSNGVEFLNQVTKSFEKNGTRFTFSGTPFHSYKASSSASTEITVISVVSILVVVVILLFIFKNPLPIICSVGSITVSVLAAFMTTVALFGKMHVLTLVFGTSLIGSCIDYSLHYFINWKGNLALKSGAEIRAHLLRGLSLSLVSTVLCYFVLIFAPFNLLKQISAFSISGITSTFLTAVCLYPMIKLPESGREIPFVEKIRPFDKVKRKKIGRTGIASLFAVAVLAVVITLISEKPKDLKGFLRIENNLSRLYKMEGKEFQNEAEASQILKYAPSAWFIVSGSTVQETLENEEKVTSALRKINEGNERGGYICTSGFIPSIKQQKISRSAAERLLPFAEGQLMYLGYSDDEIPELSSAIRNDFTESENDFIEIGKNVPEYLQSFVNSAWIGEIDGKFYSVVMPVTVTDYDAYKAIADNENIFIISKVREINRDLDRLSCTILIFFVFVYIVIFIVLKFFYSWKHCLKIISVPVLIVLWISAVFALLRIKLEFFSITGMILVFGLGLDYIIYMIENEKRKTLSGTADSSNLEPFAIVLSFVTTAVSFGALAFSRFVPVHMIGLSIFIGLVIAFVSTFLYGRE